MLDYSRPEERAQLAELRKGQAKRPSEDMARLYVEAGDG
jgi:hypothetical protein